MSSLGYCLVLLKDKYEVLEEQYLIEERLDSIEKWNLYKRYRKNPKSISEDVKQNVGVATKIKYTLKKGQQVVYGNHGFSNEEIWYYKNMKNHLEGLNKEEVEGITEAWD